MSAAQVPAGALRAGDRTGADRPSIALVHAGDVIALDRKGGLPPLPVKVWFIATDAAGRILSVEIPGDPGRTVLLPFADDVRVERLARAGQAAA